MSLLRLLLKKSLDLPFGDNQPEVKPEPDKPDNITHEKLVSLLEKMDILLKRCEEEYKINRFNSKYTSKYRKYSAILYQDVYIIYVIMKIFVETDKYGFYTDSELYLGKAYNDSYNIDPINTVLYDIAYNKGVEIYRKSYESRDKKHYINTSIRKLMYIYLNTELDNLLDNVFFSPSATNDPTSYQIIRLIENVSEIISKF